MKLVMLCLVFLLIIILHTGTDAKGYRVRSGLKFPQTGIVPVFIPVVIPIGGRYRNSYYYGLQCYSCEGKDNDFCVLGPAFTSRRAVCPRNQYCSVVRKEILPLPDSTDDTQLVKLNSSSSLLTSLTINNSSIGRVDTNKEEKRVYISRGCRSPEFLQGGLLTSTNGENLGNHTINVYTQFCLTDWCNFGDGRLKCYECNGTGSNHPCMINPANVANIVTCKPSYYCNILRTWTTSNSTTSNTATVSSTVTISRGCRSINDDEFDNEDDISVETVSCSSDLCNYVDGNSLSGINLASGMPSVICSLVVFVVFIVQ